MPKETALHIDHVELRGEGSINAEWTVVYSDGTKDEFVSVDQEWPKYLDGRRLEDERPELAEALMRYWGMASAEKDPNDDGISYVKVFGPAKLRGKPTRVRKEDGPAKKKSARPDPSEPDAFRDNVWKAARTLRQITLDELEDWQAANYDPTGEENPDPTLADVASAKCKEAARLLTAAAAAAPNDKARDYAKEFAKTLRQIDWRDVEDKHGETRVEDAAVDLESSARAVMLAGGYKFDSDEFNE